MEQNLNQFRMVGVITKVTTNHEGNLFLDLKINEKRESKEFVLEPTVYIPKDVPVAVQVGERVFISGYMKDISKQSELKPNSPKTQMYVAQQVRQAYPSKNKYSPEEYITVEVTGKLVRIDDSGNGWKRIILKTDILDDTNMIEAEVAVNYKVVDKKLISVKDLKVGSVYNVLVIPVTPIRKKNNYTATYNNLRAIFSREVVS